MIGQGRKFSPEEIDKIGAEGITKVDELMAHHKENRAIKHAYALVRSLTEDAALQNIVHSSQVRAKSEESLRGKLLGKALAASEGGELFDIDRSNFYLRLNDTIGLRLIYLSLTQFPELHKSFLELLEANTLFLLEPVKAYTFDDEVTNFFKQQEIDVKPNPRLYTSVHYIVVPSKTNPGWSAEIQVRTLAEELWGEVDHQFNYPDKHPSVACKEQILALAKLASASVRLTDSIFRSDQTWHNEHPSCE